MTDQQPISSSTSDDDDVTLSVSVSRKRVGRPRKELNALCNRSLRRRRREHEESLNFNELLLSGQIEEGGLLEELVGTSTQFLDVQANQVGEVAEANDSLPDDQLSDVPFYDETDRVSIEEPPNFQWEESLDFSAHTLGAMLDQSAPYLNMSFEELMCLEEPLSDEEDEDANCFDEVTGGEHSSLKKLEQNLAVWRSRHNITRTAMTDLLHILAEHRPLEDFMMLPKDSRTVTRHTTFVNVDGFQTVYDCAGGTLVHLGIEDQTSRILTKANVKIQDDKIIYELSTDGLGLWHSSPSSVWPWMARIVSVPCLKNFVFLVSCWFGERSKPTSGNIFTAKLVEELKLLLENGIIINNEHKAVFLRCIVADAPAKCLILEIVYFNGYSSCPKCNVFGSWNGRTFFPLCQCETAVRRTHSDYENAIDTKHHNEVPNLAKLPGFDIVEQIPFDPMHLLYRGVCKCLLSLWTAGEVPYKLSARQCTSVSAHLEECRKYIPSDFQRKPRSLIHLPFFKATEYRLFSLYIGPVCLKRELDNLRYINFLCFHVAIRILADPILCKQEDFLNYAEKLLLKFLQQFCRLYDEKFLTHNFHGLYLNHLVQDVRTLGPLESFSSFPYDSFLGHLKNKVRKGDQALQQLVNRHIEDSVLGIKQASEVSCSPQFEGLHQSGPLLSYCSSPEYKTVRFRNFQIRPKVESESFCFLKGKEVVSVENICFCDKLNGMVIVARQFLQPRDFFDVPCPSSLINIYRVSKSRVSSLKVWPVSDIVYKMMAVPYMTDLVMYPLLHCEI